MQLCRSIRTFKIFCLNSALSFTKWPVTGRGVSRAQQELVGDYDNHQRSSERSRREQSRFWVSSLQGNARVHVLPLQTVLLFPWPSPGLAACSVSTVWYRRNTSWNQSSDLTISLLLWHWFYQSYWIVSSFLGVFFPKWTIVGFILVMYSEAAFVNIFVMFWYFTSPFFHDCHTLLCCWLAILAWYCGPFALCIISVTCWYVTKTVVSSDASARFIQTNWT